MINKIHLGDCLEVMKKIPDGSVDMVLCDLPYGTTNCKWDSIISFEKLWEQYNRVCKKNAAMVFTASNPFTAALIMSNPKYFKYTWVWEKSKATGYLNAKKMPMRAHEDICIFYRKPPTYNPQKTKGTPYDKGTGHRPTSVYGSQGQKAKNKRRKELNKMTLEQVKDEMKTNGIDLTNVTKKEQMIDMLVKKVESIKVHVKNESGLRYPRTVQYFKTAESEGRKSVIHPTQKPVLLFEYLIKTYTNEGEVVLDNCIGSGTTAIACINQNRKYIGIELDEEYYNKCNERIKKHLEIK
jgi:site-specific DNA-methyltransferase (adenine-specific)